MEKFLDFFEKIGLIKKQDYVWFQESCLSECVKTSNGDLVIYIKIIKPLSPDKYFFISEKVKNLDRTIEIKIINDFKEYTANDVIDYLLYYVESNLSNQKVILKNILARKTSEIREYNLIIKYLNQEEEYILLNNKNSFKSFLERCNFEFDDIEFELDNKTNHILNFKKEIERKNEEFINYTRNKEQENKHLIKEAKQSNMIKGEATPLSELIPEQQYAIIKGEIFKIDMITTKNNFEIYKFFITDYTDSIVIKVFPKEKGITKEFINNLKIGIWVEMKVSLQVDMYEQNDLTGIANMIKVIPTPNNFNREDNSVQKRVELITHTNMTAFEGMVKLKELFSLMKKLNHKVVAITDKSNCQSFPEAMNLSSKFGIDVIYGGQFEMVDSKPKAVLNPINKKIYDCEFVFFDLETTGLSPKYDKIIEFGAIKWYKGKVVDRIQFFIDPEIDIPDHITAITKIDNSHVKGQIKIKEALEKIVNFFGDAILIAHNGIRFDLPFINCKLDENNMNIIKNTLIDTMWISRGINQQISGHSLGAICRKFKITYDETAAHRADVDSEYLMYVWNRFIEMFEQFKVKNINEINDYIQSDLLKDRTRGHQCTVYCLKNDYIKYFYQLISIALTDNYNEGPKVYKENLEKLRKYFLISNSPTEGDLFDKAMNGTDKELEELISFYDFVTVCPITCFDHEIHRNIYKKEDIIDATKRIIKIADKMNKKVIASSDTYYLNKSDSQYFDVYVHTKSIGGKRHRFFKYNDSNEVMPQLYYRTTEEMMNEFSFLKDKGKVYEIVVQNTNDIASLFEKNMQPIKNKLCSPSIEGAETKLKNLIYENARKIFGDNIHPIITERIEREIKSVIDNGFSMIYWFSHLLVKKSVEDGYMVGSRGSVGSSVTAWLINITEVCALPPHYRCESCKYLKFMDNYESGFDLPNQNCPYCNKLLIGDGHNIPFETFMGFNGDKIPDIDLNFSALYQAKAHEFIRDMFGKEKVLRAGTIGTVAEKTAYGYVKSYFESIGKTKVRNAEVMRIASKCEDVKRTTGQHPGGIIVIPNEYDVSDFTPINYPADDKTQDWYTTHFAFESLHDTLLKFDILGHDNPTVLKMLTERTNVDPNTIPNHDDKVMQLFSGTQSLNSNYADVDEILKVGTNGVPEFGTTFVKEMLLIIRPQKFSDLIRISGLSHGTFVWNSNAKDLIEQQGIKISEVISCRDDIMVYLIKQGIESLTAFKIMEDIRKGKQLKPEYEKILNENNIPKWYIESCNKIQYLFPKAHATAYVIMAWKIAWFKIYYPLHFYSSFLTIRRDVFDLQNIVAGKSAILNQMNDIKKRLASPKTKATVKNKEVDLLPIYEICLEMIARGFSIKNIDLNKSLANEFIVEDNYLIAPFSTIDGLGESVANSIVEARKDKPFTSKEDLLNRTKITKTHFKTLNDLGVLNHLEEDNQISLF